MLRRALSKVDRAALRRELGSLGVADCRAGIGDQHARQGRLVPCLELGPLLQRLTAGLEGILGTALGEEDGTGRVRRTRLEER